MISGILNIMVLVLPDCIESPLTFNHMAKLCGSLISSLVTSHGPIGANVSKLLPFDHWEPCSSCHSRSETSLQIVYPATKLMASSFDTFFVVLPIIKANSTSQSLFLEFLGMITSSLGPVMELIAFMKTIGSVGMGLLVSSA